MVYIFFRTKKFINKERPRKNSEENMSSIEDELREIEKLQKKEAGREARAARMGQEIVDRILRGESSGDPIRDFVIVYHGGSKHAEIPYRVLDHKVRENINGPVFVVHQQEGIHGCPGITAPETIDPMFIGVDTRLELGILTKPLEFKALEGIVIPTEKYATQYNSEKWKRKDGPMTLSMFDLAGFGKTIKRRTTPMNNDPSDLSNTFRSGLNIYVGTEVEAYFRKDQRPLFRGDERLDLSYVSALQLIGKEAPKDFKEAYDKKVYDERVYVITQLEQAIAREEGEKDSFSRGNLVQTTTRWLHRALGLRLHECEMKIEYRPGVTIDVHIYVRDLCKKYSIEPIEK